MSVCALMPLKITTDAVWHRCKRCMRSYFLAFPKPFPMLKIRDESSVYYHKKIAKYLDKHEIEHEFLSGPKGYLESFMTLLGAIDTDYFFTMWDDISILKNKDCLTPSVEAMEKNKKLIEVNIGDGILCTGKSNAEHIVRKGDGYAWRKSPSSYFYAMRVSTGDTVWCGQLTTPNVRLFFTLNHWTTIMRSEVFKRIHALVPYRKKDKVPDGYIKRFNHNGKCWPKITQWLEEYEMGWLNFSSCLYVEKKGLKGPGVLIKNHSQEFHA